MKIYIIAYLIAIIGIANGFHMCSCVWINGDCESCELMVDKDNATTNEYPIIYETNTTNIRFIDPGSLVIGKNKSALIDVSVNLDESNNNKFLEILNRDFLRKNATAKVIVWKQIPENTTYLDEKIDVVSLYIDNLKINDIVRKMIEERS